MGIRRWARAVVVCTLAWGCTSTYISAILGVRYEPPSDVKIVDETPGPPAVARFSGGVEMRAVGSPLPALDPRQVEELLPHVVQEAKIVLPAGKLVSAKVGSLPVGPVARYDVKGAQERVLLYVIPDGERFLTLSLTVPAGDDGRREARFERSLASLALKI